MEKPCKECGAIFYFKPRDIGRAKFCSKHCLGVSNGRRVRETASGFQPGYIPWMKGRKGTHHSPATEFKKGKKSANRMPVGSVTIRTHKFDGPRAFVKIAEPNKWKFRAVVVWESIHGPLPKGRIVHHGDRNSLNDDPLNLQAMTRAEHTQEHRLELDQCRRQAREARQTTTA
jgi:hypothetical protein